MPATGTYERDSISTRYRPITMTCPQCDHTDYERSTQRTVECSRCGTAYVFTKEDEKEQESHEMTELVLKGEGESEYTADLEDFEVSSTSDCSHSIIEEYEGHELVTYDESEECVKESEPSDVFSPTDVVREISEEITVRPVDDSEECE